MGLPTVRDYTANPAAPVLSATTNSLQDCIIGAKFPSRSMFITGADFVISTGAPTLTDGQWSIPSGGGVLVASLELIPGTRITALKWDFNAQIVSSGSMTFALKKRAPGAAAATTVFSGGVVFPSNAWTIRDGIASDNGGNPYVTLASTYYVLVVSGSGTLTPGPGLFNGAEIVHDRL